MRTIKFRGNRVDNGEWVYGDLYHGFITGNGYINGREIHPETLGQFTGLFDKSGKEIYEGDILSTQARDVSFEIVWVQENSSFMFKSNDSLNLWEVDKSVHRLEVIGNIHDNKEIK